MLIQEDTLGQTKDTLEKMKFLRLYKYSKQPTLETKTVLNLHTLLAAALHCSVFFHIVLLITTAASSLMETLKKI